MLPMPKFRGIKSFFNGIGYRSHYIFMVVHACLKTLLTTMASLRLVKESPNRKQNIVSIHVNVNSVKFTILIDVKGLYIICVLITSILLYIIYHIYMKCIHTISIFIYV